ncbi:hypothetical protein G7Y89_g10996 [Cudoniella acicularis]|uniref:Heterokaryon incompatibility domain-containing protein n=1 Tax=Cudoniella acicularis TaxID=354080 RepID=A0A8H4VYG4_9HELO|nr:hypothetical protein G7Y89_g10996 [Cudoniella acicularis]
MDEDNNGILSWNDGTRVGEDKELIYVYVGTLSDTLLFCLCFRSFNTVYRDLIEDYKAHKQSCFAHAISYAGCLTSSGAMDPTCACTSLSLRNSALVRITGIDYARTYCDETSLCSASDLTLLSEALFNICYIDNIPKYFCGGAASPQPTSSIAPTGSTTLTLSEGTKALTYTLPIYPKYTTTAATTVIYTPTTFTRHYASTITSLITTSVPLYYAVCSTTIFLTAASVSLIGPGLSLSTYKSALTSVRIVYPSTTLIVSGDGLYGSISSAVVAAAATSSTSAVASSFSNAVVTEMGAGTNVSSVVITTASGNGTVVASTSTRASVIIATAYNGLKGFLDPSGGMARIWGFSCGFALFSPTPRPTLPFVRLALYKVKVWEERPLSPYTFAQLYNGDTALSARLLIHRGVLFEAPSMASVVPSTESDRHIEQANAWLKNCSSSHLLCNGVGNAPLELPTRIVKVTANSVLESRDSHPVIRLELVDPGDYGIKYLALSHCWGTSNTFILTLSNYESCLNDINFCSLSKNMQHAVEITQRLGFSYLWIDSLCIIQDSKEDWVKESARMGSVYSGAFCTIASTGSSSGDGGCFHERNCLSLRPCRIGVSSPKALLPNWIWARRDDILDFERSIDISPLNKRAWVLQERLLSRRILHFGAEMMYWECCQRSASELSPNGYIYKKYPEDESSSQTVTEKIDPSTDFLNLNAKWGSALTWWTGKRIFHQLKAPPDAFDPDDPQINYKIWQYKRAMWKKIRKPSPQPWTEDSANVEGSGFRHSFETLRNNNFAANIVGTNSFSRHWYELVEPYSRGNLTQRKDKLVAISGIVKEIQRATGYTYVAGLWKEHVLTDMLWLTPEGPGRRRATGSAGSMDYIAPTWSWASLNAVIGHDLLPDNSRWDLTLRESLVTISDPLVTPSELGPNGEFGAVKDGSLNMEGHLCQVRVGMEGKAWFLKTDTCSRLARLFPDEAPPDPPNFYCMPFLRLKRQTNVFVQEEEVQGLVLTPCRRMVDLLPVYQRVGFFTTGRMLKGPESMKELMGAPVKIVKVI